LLANDARGDDKSLVLESAERAKRFGNKSEQNAAFFSSAFRVFIFRVSS